MDQNPVTVQVHIDANSWCGWAVAASPVRPQDTVINLWMVPADVESSCPASEEPIVVSVPIGKLDAGSHTVLIWRAAQTGPNGHNAEVLDSLSFTVAAGPSSTLLLHHGRFEATVSWRAFDGSSGVGRVVPGSSQESGLFWFFGPGNWELLVKVLDGCAVNGAFWVLGAGGTNVEFTVEIKDVLTHETWTYTNPSGHPAGSFFDTAAFPGACHSPPPGP
ncbi:MAG TPA: hypothetical protein VFS60_03510 [Thermoanaerobaculia bacterium]|nr:hypothetical protein [Thermoanaerobaculia bacterium]